MGTRLTRFPQDYELDGRREKDDEVVQRGVRNLQTSERLAGSHRRTGVSSVISSSQIAVAWRTLSAETQRSSELSDRSENVTVRDLQRAGQPVVRSRLYGSKEGPVTPSFWNTGAIGAFSGPHRRYTCTRMHASVTCHPSP